MRCLLLAALVLAGCGRGAADAPRAPGAAPGAPGAPGAIDRAALVGRVRAETRHAWASYAKYAWGHDELRPETRSPRDWYGASLLITPVDSLDTLVMLGLTDEAAAARQLIDDQLSFDKDV